MANMADAAIRPNIRIEIQNNIVEPMDVDDNEKPVDSDFEDGEISDKNEPLDENVVGAKSIINSRTWSNTDGGFTTGFDIFDKKEQEKLQERANRFGLKPDEINNFTDDQLQKLHASLGITVDNEKSIRFEAIHMRGTDDMSTEDIFEYFGKYGPAYIEWINDESCNVVWQDKISAARALHFVSKIIKGMPVEGPCDPFAKEIVLTEANNKNCEKEEDNVGHSILLVNKNREVQLENEDPEIPNKENEGTVEEYVNISDITIPIPPGYWRLGIEHPKTKCIILRFAYKTDKKPLKAERFSEYYKKYGNPNFGGMKGLISESRRNKFKGIFDRNRDIKNVEDGKNPWGDLAENWNSDEKFSEKVYEPQVISSCAIINSNVEKPDIMKRLGAKRNHDTDTESTDSQENVAKKSKVPRMRMYADEEEDKIKRKKQLLAIKSLNTKDDSNKVTDLRNIIGISSKKTERSVEQDSHFGNSDLGSKLKNRTRTEGESKHSHPKHETLRYNRKQDIEIKATKERGLESGRQGQSSTTDKHLRRKHESPSHRRSTRHKDNFYKNKLHSDKYEQRKYTISDDDFDYQKPKSKVAVVIKTQKRPTVASTIWSRINPKKERLKTASERLRSRKESSSSSDSSSESNSGSSSSSKSSSESSSESEEESNDESELPQAVTSKTLERPGFRNSTQAPLAVTNRKSPLRIEISNDHFKEE